MATGAGTGTVASDSTAYATVAEMREMLPQVPAGAATDMLLGELLERATRIVDGELGFSFVASGAASDLDFSVRVTEPEYLRLPNYAAGTLTHVYELSAKGSSAESMSEVTDYDVLDDGRLYRWMGWRTGWYRATAIWGVVSVPAAIVQVTLEVAVNLWRGRDRGLFSDVVGVEGGGAVGYTRALTNQQRMIIQNERLAAGMIGVA